MKKSEIKQNLIGHLCFSKGCNLVGRIVSIDENDFFLIKAEPPTKQDKPQCWTSQHTMVELVLNEM